MRKLSLVNETLRLETEMRPRRLTFSPRRDRDVPTFHRDRDETEDVGKMCLETVSRPRRRDRDYIPAEYPVNKIFIHPSIQISDNQTSWTPVDVGFFVFHFSCTFGSSQTAWQLGPVANSADIDYVCLRSTYTEKL